MASPVKTYQKEMHGNLGFFATWLPGDGIEVGDVGVLEEGRFRRQGTLEGLGIAVRVSERGQPQTVQYQSSSGTRIDLSAGVDAAAVNAGGSISIDFTREGAFLFHAMDLQQLQIEDRRVVNAGILDAYERKEWDRNWFVVEAVHRARCASVVVSEGSTSGLVVSAHAEGPLGSVPLANPEVRLDVASSKGRVFHVLGAKNLHPLYSCMRVKDPLFGDPKVAPVRGAAGSVKVARPSIADLLDS